MSNLSYSALCEHALQKKYTFDIDNNEVLQRHRLILESLSLYNKE